MGFNNRFKFKVWDEPNKCFLIKTKKDFETQYVDVYQTPCKNGWSSLSWCLDRDEFIVIKCIDIRDINQKLIYEGDILKDINYPDSLFYIIWCKEELKYKIVKLKDKYELMNLSGEYANKYLEIIGNIL